MFGQLGVNAVDVAAGQVDFVQRHDHGDVGRFGVMYCLDGLRHNAVVCGDDKHDDVGHICASCPHSRKRLVARRIEECNLTLPDVDLICADVLGDSACLAGGNVSGADFIQQARFAVVNVAEHSGYDGASFDVWTGSVFKFRCVSGLRATPCVRRAVRCRVPSQTSSATSVLMV